MLMLFLILFFSTITNFSIVVVVKGKSFLNITKVQQISDGNLALFVAERTDKQIRSVNTQVAVPRAKIGL